MWEKIVIIAGAEIMQLVATCGTDSLLSILASYTIKYIVQN
jgi:hypothetical protein